MDNLVEIMLGIFIGVMGLLVGSFLNVCIYRIPQKTFFKDSRSYCPKCEHTLAWFDLFPLFSYLFLGGKCRYCKEPISPRYPIVESLNCILWVVIFLVYKITPITPVLLIMASTLIVMSMIDFDIMEIPNGLNAFLVLLGVASLIMTFFNVSITAIWWENLVGAVCVSGFLLIVSLLSGGGIGGGDIKLMFAVGFIIGYKLIIVAALIGMIVGGLFSIVLLIVNKKTNRKSHIPFGPFLAIGIVSSILFGTPLINWYISLLGF